MKKNALALIALAGLIAWGIYDFTTKREAAEPGATPTENATDGAAAVGLKKGNLAPDFTLKLKDGTDVKLSDYRGKTVLLNFWASWCPPCRIEMPHMQDFYEAYKSGDVVVLAVNMSHLEKKAGDADALLQEVGASFPTVYDEEGKVTDRYQIVAYPTTYVLNANGVITDRFQGAIDYDMMVKSYEKASSR